ncbi:MAG: leucine-rich repeat protein [Eubacterium sp.]|nr:leucine-rich repeat protein [Eubacterium sp.]
MKKIISLILSAVMLLSVTAGLNISVYATDLSAIGTCGDRVYYTFNSETGALTISGKGDMEDYSSNFSPFCSKDTILSVTINEGVTGIGKKTFHYSSNIKSVTLPNSLSKIGDSAFYYCSGITEISIPDSVTVIGNGAFYHCDSMTSLKISENIETIADNAFSYCSGLESVTIPNSVSNIGTNAFSFCSSLTNINFGNGLTTIGTNAFSNCKALKNITLPNGLTSIGSSAFYYCDALESISIPDSVTNISNLAFFACTSLKSVKIPEGATRVNEKCFYLCNSLESVTIPGGVTSIEEMAFSGCNELSDVYYSSTVEDWNKIKIVNGKNNGNSVVLNANIHCTDGFAHCRHENTVVKKENIKGVTVNEKGSYDNVTRCALCNAEFARETVEVEAAAPALIIHWSSIDGVDLELPVVIENVNPDSTVNEVLENAGYKSNSDIFTKDGYVEFHLLYPKPMTEYKELGEVFDYAKLMTISSETRNTKIGENGLDIYTAEYIRLPDDTEVKIKVEAPVCGTSTTTQKYEEENDVWDFSTQTNYPIVTIPENVHYYLAVDVAPENHATELQNGAWVLNETTYNQPYIGTFEGGKPYYAFTGVLVEYGYLFPNSGPKLTINGIEPSAYSAGSRVGAWGIVPVMAVHTPVTDKAIAPTCAKKGKTEGSHCSACSEVIAPQKEIAATGKHRYTVKTVNPTYAAKGYKLHTCSVCGKSYKSDYTAKLTVPKISITKLTKKKNAFNVEWKNVSVATGYQIQYSTAKNFKTQKTVTVKGAKSVSKTIKKLKSKKRYYVRVRAYKTYKGKNYYSGWSNVNSIKTK